MRINSDESSLMILCPLWTLLQHHTRVQHALRIRRAILACYTHTCVIM